MEHNSHHSPMYQGKSSYIHENCHFTTTYLQVEAVHLRRHFLGLAIVLFTIAPLTIIFNLLTIMTFIYRTKFRVPSNIFLCGMAITDLITGSTAIPIMGTTHLLRYLDKRVSCRFFISGWILMLTVIFLTFTTMTLISIDKYLAIFYPFKYSAKNDKQTLMVKILATLWTIVICLGAFTIFTPELKLVRTALMVTSSILIPLVIFIQLRILLEIRKRRRRVCVQRTISRLERTFRGFRIRNDGTQGLRVTTTIVIVLFVCYLPITTMGLLGRINFLNIHSGTNKLIYCWLSTLVLLNSLMNPVIYCWQLRGFRRDLTDLLRKPNVIRPTTQLYNNRRLTQVSFWSSAGESA